jgi:hypothetical protein
MTITVKCKSSITNYSSNGYLIACYDFAGNKRQWGILANGSTDTWGVIASDDGSGSNSDETGMSITTEWVIITVVADQTARTWDFYFDGIFYEQITLTEEFSQQGSFFTLGGLVGGNTFLGDVEYARIASRKYTASEIKAQHDNPWKAWRQGLSIAEIVAAQGGAPPVTGAIMSLMQKNNLGAKLYQGTFIQ